MGSDTGLRRTGEVESDIGSVRSARGGDRPFSNTVSRALVQQDLGSGKVEVAHAVAGVGNSVGDTNDVQGYLLGSVAHANRVLSVLYEDVLSPAINDRFHRKALELRLSDINIQGRRDDSQVLDADLGYAPREGVPDHLAAGRV